MGTTDERNVQAVKGSRAQEMLNDISDHMTDPPSAGGAPKGKKKSAPSGSKRRGNGSRKHGAGPDSKVDQTEPLSPDPVSRLERTRRLLLAALRLWELKRRTRD